jgi:hypothetical protein
MMDFEVALAILVMDFEIVMMDFEIIIAFVVMDFQTTDCDDKFFQQAVRVNL